MGLALAASGKTIKAVHFLLNSLNSANADFFGRGNKAAIHFNLANILKDAGDFEGAILHYNKSLEMDPGYANAHYNLGYVLSRKGRLPLAVYHYQRAIERSPRNPELLNSYGLTLLRMGIIDGAESYFRRALDIQPGHAGSTLNLNNLLPIKSKIDGAILKLETDLAEYFAVPGDATMKALKMNKQLLDNAISRLEKMLETVPGFRQKHFSLMNYFPAWTVLRNYDAAVFGN